MKHSLLLVAILITLTQSLSQAQDFYYEPGIDLGHYTPFSPDHKYIANYYHYGLDLRDTARHPLFQKEKPNDDFRRSRMAPDLCPS